MSFVRTNTEIKTINMTNYDLFCKAWEAALRVKFLTSREELLLYSSALYFAMEWGKKVR